MARRTLKLRKPRVAVAAAALPIFLASIHALTQSEKHVGPMRGLGKTAAEKALAANPSLEAQAQTLIDHVTDNHGERIAQAAGATLAAATVQAVFAKDAKPALALLIASAPVLTVANSGFGRQKSREESTRAFVRLAPLLTSLIMVLQQEVKKEHK